MANKNIQMKFYNGVTWDNLFPKTMSSLTTMSDGKTLQVAHDELKTLVGTKVDKVSGKALSANDFTNAFKLKLEGLEDHTQDITNLQSKKADKSTTYTKAEVDERLSTATTGIPVQKNEPEGADMWFKEL